MDYGEMRRSLEAQGAVRDAADSEEARRLMRRVDAGALERAAKRGDVKELKQILDQVLSTPEGKALAQKVQGAVRRDG